MPDRFLTSPDRLRRVLLAALLALAPGAAMTADAPKALLVAVAASMQYPFEALRAAYQAETGRRLHSVINSSGKLTAQIVNGAPYDVFLSADMAFPQTLFVRGFTSAAPRAYAYGQLVLWTMRTGLDLEHWQTTLTSPAVGKIAIANPKLAPYGEQSLRALAYFKLDARLQDKLVIGESIGQTNQYIHSGAADIGFTAKSVVLAPEMAGQGRWIDLPRSSYQPIAQGAVILRHGMATLPAPALAFLSFLNGPKARAIFAQYGYLLP